MPFLDGNPDWEGSRLELHPTRAAIRGYQFHHGAPWGHRRDDTEPNADTSANVKTCAPWAKSRATDLGEMLHFAGGVQQIYAGDDVVELGFLWAPEVLWIDSTDTVNANLEDGGVYYYTATYSHIQNGRIHRSAPASPVQFTNLAPNAQSMRVYVRTMTISMKDRETVLGQASPITLEIWRTYYEDGASVEDGGTHVFKRVFCEEPSGVYPIVDTPVNDRDEWYMTVVDGQGDAELRRAESLAWQLDTTTLTWNIPPPIPPPACDVACEWENRLWTAKGSLIHYSNELIYIGAQIGAPEFSTNNVFNTHGIGRITGLIPMDNRLFVTTRDGIYALVGDGNLRVGTGSTLRLEVVVEGIGCIEPASIVIIPAIGFTFQSANGLYAFTRETGIDYIGAPVEDLVREAGNVRAATLLEDRHQIRFTINRSPTGIVPDPYVLTWDYLRNKWSEIDAPAVASATTARLNEMVDACAWRGEEGETLHVFLQHNGLAVERAASDTVYADTAYSGAAGVAMDARTGWIEFGEFVRIRKLGLLFDRPHESDITVEIAIDRNGTYAETVVQTIAIAAGAPAYYEVPLQTQKMAAIMVRIYESGTVDQTENLRLVRMTFLVGRRKGLRAVPAVQVRGT
jgi:hypothetical protein